MKLQWIYNDLRSYSCYNFLLCNFYQSFAVMRAVLKNRSESTSWKKQVNKTFFAVHLTTEEWKRENFLHFIIPTNIVILCQIITVFLFHLSLTKLFLLHFPQKHSVSEREKMLRNFTATVHSLLLALERNTTKNWRL